MTNSNYIDFNFLGSSRLPFNPTENIESTRTYYLGEKLKFRLGVPVQNILSKNLALIIKVGVAQKSIPYSASLSTGEYIEFEYLVEGSDIGELRTYDFQSINKLVVSANNTGWSGDQHKKAPVFFIYPPIMMKGYIPTLALSTGRSFGFEYASPHPYSPPTVIINGNSDLAPLTANKILLKRSSTAGKVPQPSDLVSGELAVNTTDGRLFLKKNNDSIISITPIEPQIFSTNSLVLSSSQNDFEIGNQAVVRISASAANFTISGFLPGVDGELKMIYNAGANKFVILNNSQNSEEGNRIIISKGEDYEIEPNFGFSILYDSAAGAWRLFN